MSDNRLCFTAAEVSEKTGISLSLVRKLTRDGEIPHIRVGRRILYPAAALKAWMTLNTTGNITPEKEGGLDG